MDWIKNLNNALDYIESSLDKEFDVNQAARLAVCSPFHFQRMFTYISGQTLGEYIRRRKMTLAAFDLVNSNIRVLDLALKYGYDSPTSFTRAFQKIHGVTPKAARENGVTLSAYPRITFTLSIKGEEAMNYRIEQRGEFRIVGTAIKGPMTMEDCLERVPKFWAESASQGVIPKLCALMDGTEPQGVLGVSTCNDIGCNGYYIAVASNKPCPEDMEEYIVPKATWAVFECEGSMPETIQTLQKRIITEWFPTCGYEYDNGPDIEVYLTETNTPKSKAQVWVPVIKK